MAIECEIAARGWTTEMTLQGSISEQLDSERVRA